MAQEIGVGLVGYGGIGRMHALCYRMLPLAYPDLPHTPRIVAVATASTASAERARHELGDVMVTTDVDKLINHPDVAVVDCCTPTDDHAQTARAVLLAGKPLFCEKPLTAVAKASEKIAALAAERSVLGGMNFHFRQVPAIQEARRRIEAGFLGDVYSFHMRYYRSSNLKRNRPISWRFTGPGSGVLVDLGSHLIDLTLHLFGPVAAVAARTRTLIDTRIGPDGQPMPIESDDVAWLNLELAGGGHGTIEASKVVPAAADDVRIEAYGSRGTLIFDTRDPNILQVGETADRDAGGQSIATLSKTNPPASLPGTETPTGVIQWHMASIAAFLMAIGTGVPSQPDLNDGLQVDRVLTAALRSASKGGERISL